MQSPAYRKSIRAHTNLFTKDVYVTWNITGEYEEWLRPEIMHRPYINGYKSGRTGVIAVSFGMQAQLE